jgi:hypothetical protein
MVNKSSKKPRKTRTSITQQRPYSLHLPGWRAIVKSTKKINEVDLLLKTYTSAIYIHKALFTKTATNLDLISIALLESQATIILDCQ